jgi:hypothetical protein
MDTAIRALRQMGRLEIHSIGRPSPYLAGRSGTGVKVHAVAPGSVVRDPETFERVGTSLCSERVTASALEHFDPQARDACQRCSDSVRRLRGPAA